MLIGHHRHVVEAIHVRQRLDVSLALCELFGRAMQQADMRIGTLNGFAVQLQHEAKHAVRRRMLRPEVHGVVADFSHAIYLGSRSCCHESHAERFHAVRW